MGERSYQKDTIRLGVGGMDLRRAVDAIPNNRFARLKNVMRTLDGAFTTRPGQTAINATAVGTTVHSVIRLDDPQNNTWTRLLGIDSAIYIGQNTFTQLDIGYSGQPLSFLVYRPYTSGDAWAFIADSQRMRKVRRDGISTPIGIKPPTDAVVVNSQEVLTKVIDDCEDAWAPHDTSSATAAVVHSASPYANNLMQLTVTASGAAPGVGFAEKTISLDLSTFDGVNPATDDDFIHFFMNGGDQSQWTEARLYFVCSTYDPAYIPGQTAGKNTDAFFKVFTPSELNPAIAEMADFYTATDAKLKRMLRETDLTTGPQATAAMEEYTAAVQLAIQQNDTSRIVAERLAIGTSSWTEFGTFGRPLRRGDFSRIGSDDTKGWNTITGIMLTVTTIDSGTAVVQLDNFSIDGGYGPDTTAVDSSPYDYRYTHYDPRTGAESNPSPIMTTGLVSTNRQKILLQLAGYMPPSYWEGDDDPNFRQRVYRRGGTLNNDWYYLGVNTANGGSFYDTFSDTEIEAAGTLATDHDQPVTTADTNGTAVYGQNLPYLAGPLGGLYLFGCGDPYRKGDLYWSRPGEPDHWPAANHQEVCAPSEELLAPLMYNGNGFVLSRARMFQAYYNLSASGAAVTVVPTACGHGVAGPWAWCVGPEIYFASRDGIYATSGGAERSLSEDDLAPLFHREWIPRDASEGAAGGSGYGEGGYGEGGYGEGGASTITTPPPIDWEREEHLRMEVFENELYFTYQDTFGYIQTLVYSLTAQEWRWYQFGKSPVTLHTEKYGQSSRLLIGADNGKLYEHTGLADDGVPINCLVRTGARDQSAPRNEKLYGDLAVDSDPKTATFTIRSYMNPAETFLTQSERTGTGRDLSIHDHYAGGQYGRTTTLEAAWTAHDSRPLLYAFELGYFIDPERTAKRATDWDDLGAPSYKLVKGLVIEANTFGQDKVLSVQADGGEQLQITINTNGRLQQEFAFSAFQGKLVRIAPTTDTQWLLYAIKWISEPIPLGLTRWESRPLDLGNFGYMIHFDSYVTLSSTATSTYTLTFDGTTVHTYTIPSTGGVIRKIYVPFTVNKALLVQYTLTSDSPVMVYKNETHVRIYPWGKDNYIIHHPFGSDDLDEPPVR